MTDLFRKEAISHATRRLSGTVVLATPLSVRLLGLFFGVIVFAAVLSPPRRPMRARRRSTDGWFPTRA